MTGLYFDSVQINKNSFHLKLDLQRKLNSLEELIDERNRQLNGANEQRKDFDKLLTKLNDFIKTTEQQIKDPFANDLQQNTNGMKDKYKTIQVKHRYYSI